LLKAHVEASVEFSILLSGVIVKFGIFGLFRYIIAPGAQLAVTLLAALALVAMLEATLKLPSQRDLKRIVALTTVVEMNWLVFATALGGHYLDNMAQALVIVHSFATALEFYLVECLSRRFGTRDMTKLTGLAGAAPVL